MTCGVLDFRPGLRESSTDKARLFIELTAKGFAELRRELVERSVSSKETWWGTM